MVDTERGREKRTRNAARHQRERKIQRARHRVDGPEAARERASEDGRPKRCHRRDCDEPPAFLVLERYLEDSGHGAVEATAALCREHTAEESPTRLDDVYAGYVFRVEPLPGTTESPEP